MKFTEIKIKGEKVQVDINAEGVFSGEIGGETVTGSSMGELKRRLTAIAAKESVSIPAILFEEGERWRGGSGDPILEPIMVTGRHSANNNVLYVDGMGNRHQQQHYGAKLLRQMTKAEQSALLDALKDRDAASDRYTKLLLSFQFDYDKAVGKKKS